VLIVIYEIRTLNVNLGSVGLSTEHLIMITFTWLRFDQSLEDVAVSHMTKQLELERLILPSDFIKVYLTAAYTFSLYYPPSSFFCSWSGN